jgi:hypothetical protein
MRSAEYYLWTHNHDFTPVPAISDSSCATGQPRDPRIHAGLPLAAALHGCRVKPGNDAGRPWLVSQGIAAKTETPGKKPEEVAPRQRLSGIERNDLALIADGLQL